MKTLEQARFQTFMGPVDTWRITGYCSEVGNDINISCAVFYNKINKIVKTISGSLYKINSFQMPEDKFEKEIEEQIAKGTTRIG